MFYLVLLLSLHVITSTFWSPNGHLDQRTVILESEPCEKTYSLRVTEKLFYLSERHQQNSPCFGELACISTSENCWGALDLRWREERVGGWAWWLQSRLQPSNTSFPIPAPPLISWATSVPWLLMITPSSGLFPGLNKYIWVTYRKLPTQVSNHQRRTRCRRFSYRIVKFVLNRHCQHS